MGEGADADDDLTAQTRSRLPVWKKAVFGLVATGLILGLLELMLLIVGVRPLTEGDDPFVGFSSSIPHLVTEGDVVRRSERRASVMNDVSFPNEKPVDAVRIFCVGGSTTYGRPYWDETSFAGYLRAMLREGGATEPTEVINLGALSYASYRISGVMREAAEYESDVFVVYTGHNEFLEHRTYQAAREMSPALRRAASMAAGTRIGTVLRALGGATGVGPSGLDDDVDHIAVDEVGPEAYRRDDPWREVVVGEFRSALHGMVDIAEESGAQIVFVVPASNVRGFAPFRSEASDALDAADAIRFVTARQAGETALEEGRTNEAVEALREATSLDPRHAEAWFLYGRALLAAGAEGDADVAFLRALEEDICPLRAIEATRATVREVAAERHVPAVEFEALIDETGQPGMNWFADHVHPWPAANARLAAELASTLGRIGSITPAGGWTPDAAREAVARLDAAVDRETHATQLFLLTRAMALFDHPDVARDVAARAEALLGGGEAAALRASEALITGRDVEGALRVARRTVDEAPDSSAAASRLGVVLALSGSPEPAREQLERALRLDETNAEAHMQLGAISADEGSLTMAERHFREALRIEPDNANHHVNVALILMRRNRTAEAEPLLTRALELVPDHPRALDILASLKRAD